MTSAIAPGSAEPASAAEIDEVLACVPELAFMPVFERCVPTTTAPRRSHTAVDAHFTSDRMADVVVALRELATRAHHTNNGGLAFLVRAMLHFIEVEAVPCSQHPLFVALFLRGAARAERAEETPRAIAAAMDAWG